MAMPRSACLIGSTSLTPSPIMATRWPAPLQGLDDLDLLPRRDPAEDARAPAAAAPRSAAAASSAPVTTSSRPAAGSRRLTVARTVSGLSPEMILKRMPCAASAASTSAASGRSSSLRATSASGRSRTPRQRPVERLVQRPSALGEQQQPQAGRQQLLPGALPAARRPRAKNGCSASHGPEHQGELAAIADPHAHGAVAVLRLERQLVEHVAASGSPSGGAERLELLFRSSSDAEANSAEQPADFVLVTSCVHDSHPVQARAGWWSACRSCPCTARRSAAIDSTALSRCTTAPRRSCAPPRG